MQCACLPGAQSLPNVSNRPIGEVSFQCLFVCVCVNIAFTVVIIVMARAAQFVPLLGFNNIATFVPNLPICVLDFPDLPLKRQ